MQEIRYCYFFIVFLDMDYYRATFTCHDLHVSNWLHPSYKWFAYLCFAATVLGVLCCCIFRSLRHVQKCQNAHYYVFLFKDAKIVCAYCACVLVKVTLSFVVSLIRILLQATRVTASTSSLHLFWMTLILWVNRGWTWCWRWRYELQHHVSLESACS